MPTVVILSVVKLAIVILRVFMLTVVILSVVMLTVVILSVVKLGCFYAYCHCKCLMHCCVISVTILSDFMISVIVLNDIRVSVVPSFMLLGKAKSLPWSGAAGRHFSACHPDIKH
jgi:hypothetical protein